MGTDGVKAQSYEDAGVAGQGAALSAVVRHLQPTLTALRGGEVMTRFGQYASVIKLSDDIAIALSTDGVGSKTMLVAAMDKYDTIGHDCVAMNVNDVICVGATPLAMLDYLAVHTLDESRTDQILEGLGAAACEAGIAIPGGELAQLPEIVGGAGEESAFDIVGTCVGVVNPDRMILGQDVAVGDAIIGIESSGIHSNGMTLARRSLLGAAGYSLSDEIPRLGCTLGEELLKPTVIYVAPVLEMWAAGIETPGLAHITSDGFANLCRLDARVGYGITDLPTRPAIFDLVQEAGGIGDPEMFRVFNMGIGFVVIVRPDDCDAAVAIATRLGYPARRIGIVTSDSGRVTIGPAGITGGLDDGASRFEAL